MRILIVTGGRIDMDFAPVFLENENFDHIIVVDGALAFWDKLESKTGAAPHFDYLVGDFDTIDGDILERYIHRADITVKQFIPEKDNTDTDIAVRLAEELCQAADEKEVVLLGATGTRTDHMLSNIQLLIYLHSQGIKGVIVDKFNRITYLETAQILYKHSQFGAFVSIIPLSDKLTGVTLTGFKYPLISHDVYKGESLCVSNEIIAETATIHIDEGQALLIEARD